MVHWPGYRWYDFTRSSEITRNQEFHERTSYHRINAYNSRKEREDTQILLLRLQGRLSLFPVEYLEDFEPDYAYDACGKA
jgi:hypothetical protein